MTRCGPLAALRAQVRKDGDRLQRLAEAHLVGEDRVHAVVEALRDPARLLPLVRPHLAASIAAGCAAP